MRTASRQAIGGHQPPKPSQRRSAHPQACRGASSGEDPVFGTRVVATCSTRRAPCPDHPGTSGASSGKAPKGCCPPTCSASRDSWQSGRASRIGAGLDREINPSWRCGSTTTKRPPSPNVDWPEVKTRTLAWPKGYRRDYGSTAPPMTPPAWPFRKN